VFSFRGANYDQGQKGQLHRAFALLRPWLKDMANWDIINVGAGESSGRSFICFASIRT
jgi:hypothetical protein